MFRLLDDPKLAQACSEASGRLADSFHWSEVLQPLIEFCRAPGARRTWSTRTWPRRSRRSRRGRRRIPPELLAVARLVRDGDVETLVRKTGSRVKRALQR